jgi:hypothetical protein
MARTCMWSLQPAASRSRQQEPPPGGIPPLAAPQLLPAPSAAPAPGPASGSHFPERTVWKTRWCQAHSGHHQ